MEAGAGCRVAISVAFPHITACQRADVDARAADACTRADNNVDDERDAVRGGDRSSGIASATKLSLERIAPNIMEFGPKFAKLCKIQIPV